MDLHERHDGVQLAVAADDGERVIEMPPLGDLVRNAFAMPVGAEPARRLAQSLGAVALAFHRLGGEPCHQSAQHFEHDQRLVCLRARERTDVGSAMSGERDDAFRREALE